MRDFDQLLLDRVSLQAASAMDPRHHPNGTDGRSAAVLLNAAHAMAACRALDETATNASAFKFDATVGAVRLTVEQSSGLYRATLHVLGQATSTTWDSSAAAAVVDLAEVLEGSDG